MKKASILLAQCLPAFLFAGCTLVFAEGDPDPEERPTNTPTAGTRAVAEAGVAGESGEGGAGTVVPPAGGDGQGGTPSEDPAGGHAGTGVTEPGLGAPCQDETTCVEAAPECPQAAGYCTFYCDEAWVNGWQYVDDLVDDCEAQGGTCTPISEERSYCVP
jgi:hypothetical protein